MVDIFKKSLVNGNGRLTLAYQELTEVPPNVVKNYAAATRELDLSFNKISELRSLEGFYSINTLILDNNDIKSHVKFPPLPNLHTLWINRNRISNLTVFIENIAREFPKLTYLSMMNNSAAPSYFNGGSYQQYTDYRYYVISQLPDLTMLDDKPVDAEERYEAEKIYKPRLTVRKSKSKKKQASSKKTRKKRTSSKADMPAEEDNQEEGEES
ncbi:leucine-rich melanocyte differentiation-associated protein-like [Amphiura filiformis]|uniref:leucine-rich melanocyte differentiation-associated protein-like n=1 Tax=Amphiura filiformis TaxID=82378 RepID=UPI003B20EFE4